mmetsp:Transcript_4180/g.10753  ORF Transcript_4180/g.10753 Transcript_4180/m.10753 type:complete len:315 (+) Transcript_4180:595-1539(+)
MRQLVHALEERLRAHVDVLHAQLQLLEVSRPHVVVHPDNAAHHLLVLDGAVAVAVEDAQEVVGGDDILRHRQVEQHLDQGDLRVVQRHLNLIDAQRAIAVHVHHAQDVVHLRAHPPAVVHVHLPRGDLGRLRCHHRVLHDVRDDALDEPVGCAERHKVEEQHGQRVHEHHLAADVAGELRLSDHLPHRQVGARHRTEVLPHVQRLEGLMLFQRIHGANPFVRLAYAVGHHNRRRPQHDGQHHGHPRHRLGGVGALADQQLQLPRALHELRLRDEREDAQQARGRQRSGEAATAGDRLEEGDQHEQAVQAGQLGL